MNGGLGDDVFYSRIYPSTTTPSTIAFPSVGTDTMVGGPGNDTFWIGPSTMQTITDLEAGEIILYHTEVVDPSNECYSYGHVTYEDIEAELGEFKHLTTSIVENGPGIWTPSMVDLVIEICNVDTGACYNPPT